MNQNRHPDVATDCAANAIHSPGSTRFRPRFFNSSAGFSNGSPRRRKRSPRNFGDSPDFLRHSPGMSGASPRYRASSPGRFFSSPDGTRLSPGVASCSPDTLEVPPTAGQVPPTILGFPPTVLEFPRPGELFPRRFLGQPNICNQLKTGNLGGLRPFKLGKPSKSQILSVLAPISDKSTRCALDLAFEIMRQIQNQKT